MAISNMPRELTSREKAVDRLYLAFQLLSKWAFLPMAVIGYATEGIAWASVGALGAVLAGFWMRRSMGLRGSDPHTGFFIRARERANGSSRGLLEWLLEKLRGAEFSRAQCKAFADAYDVAMSGIQKAGSEAERTKIARDLDRRVKEISYGWGAFGDELGNVSQRYEHVKKTIAAKAEALAASVDVETESAEIARACAVSRKPRQFSAYQDVALRLLDHYDPLIAYFIAVELNEQHASQLGYPPIGQIVLAVEHLESATPHVSPSSRARKASEFLAYALLNFPDVDTARKAYTVYQQPAVKQRVAEVLRSYDEKVALYVVS